MVTKKDSKEEDHKKFAHHYTAEDISVLEGLEPVRKRPGMYIGGTGIEGLHHLIWEIFDNSRDEAMGNFADWIEVVLLPGNRVRIADNGRGIPIDIHKQTKVSALETVMTTLHAGGKFGGKGYKVSGGLHGVGGSVVNALSTYMKAEIHRDGGRFIQEYSRGKKKTSVKKIDKSNLHGTIITFEPDPEIFKEIKWNWNMITNRLRQQAYLVKKLRITLIDARDYADKIDDSNVFYFNELALDLPSVTFYFEGGLVSLVKFTNRLLAPAHGNIFYVDRGIDDVDVEVALQYVDDDTERILAFANTIYNQEGGTHVTGFKTALTRTLNNYAKKNEYIKEGDNSFTGDDALGGLTAVISVKMLEIQFEGQTKGKLGSPQAQSAVAAVFGDAFSTYLEENPNDAKIIINKIILSMRARKAAKAAKDSILRKGALEGMTLPGKLADCQTRNAEEAELFIVEGDSAGGCFSEETEIALADGRNLSFKELIKEHQENKENFCYTIKRDGSVGIVKIENPRITKKNAEVVKVILDNNEEIICTPDHKFMLNDGSYKKATALLKSDSLMPLYRKMSKIGERITIDGYEIVWDPVRKWIFTHMLSDEYNLDEKIYTKKQGDCRHHIDFNKLNNNPTNIIRISKEEHLVLHTENLAKTLHREDAKEKARQAHKSDEYRRKMSDWANQPEVNKMLSERAQKQWEDEEYKEYMTQKFIEFYNSNEAYRQENNIRLNEEQRKYWSQSENRQKASEKVKKFFEENPDAKEYLSSLAKEQWQDEMLILWHRQKTSEQWTPEFRKKRKETYNETYFKKTVSLMKKVFDRDGNLNNFDAKRIENKDHSILSFNTFCERFFDGNPENILEYVKHYNHKIKKIERLNIKIDVYDLEVPETNNFALASGVFVHNSAKQGRDRRTQAILPLRGKILNVERARIDKMLASKEVKSLVIALGASIGDTFDLSKIRYHKIIIATDADVDGAHIRTLLLTLFYRYFRPIIENGNIFIAQPPLYKIKKGKEVFYAYSDEEKNKIIGKEKTTAAEELLKAAIGEKEEPASAESYGEAKEEESEIKDKELRISVQRYKGLGEMNPEELWETTMDSTKRVLKKVTIDDAEEANRTFDMLMGVEVGPRKSFIQTNAKMANIDI